MATNRLPTATKKRTARKTDVISGPADPTESAAAGLLPQAFLELAPDAIIVADGEGRILLVNHQTEVLFGYARSELLGVPVELLLPQPTPHGARAAPCAVPDCGAYPTDGVRT